jgi:hypothetical protein
MQITVDDVLSWSPCNQHPSRALVSDMPRKLIAIFGGRKSLTPTEILDLSIPINDRFWILLREPIFTKMTLRLLAYDFAEHVLPIWEDWAKDHLWNHLEAPRDLIEVVREYPDQPWKWATEWDAAWEVAGSAGTAAWAARSASKGVKDAVWAAASAVRAALWAAGDADWAVAWAARSAARDYAKETKWQIELIRKKLNE